MPLELVYFHRGLSYDARSALQKGGFLKVCKNINLETEGTQTLRDAYGTLNSEPFSGIHSIKRYGGKIFTGDERNFRSNYSLLIDSFSAKPWMFEEYKDFLLGTNQNEFIMVDEDSNAYSAQVSNPCTACTGAAGIAGSPSGHYMLYYSFYITWPNGQTYETGLSPVSADVSVTSQKISWTGIGVSTYSAYYGEEPTIYRKLYRGPGTGGTLGDIYYVDTIEDNTTTTYTDNYTDAELEANDYETVADYLPTIIPKYFTAHYGRLHMISADYPHRLYWTEEVLGADASENESLMPLAITDTNWDDMRVSGLKEVDPQGIITWGINLFIPLKQTWLRREGNDPDTWAYRKTYSKNGIGAPYTVDVSTYPGGIIGLTNPEGGDLGITIFNGQYDKVLTSPRLDYIFKKDINVNYISNCRGKCIGRYYHFLYPSGRNTSLDKHLTIDMRRYPDIRIAEWTDINGQCIESDMNTTKVYFGCSDGYVRSQDTRETVDFELETHDMVGGSAELTNELKTFQEIKYALDSDGDDVTLKVYIDDVLMKWSDGTTSKTISGTGETLQYLRSLPKDWAGYRIRLNLSGTDMSKVEIYSPWKILFQAGG